MVGVSERGKWERPSLEQRALAKIDRRGDDECWPWLGAVNAQGYGTILPNGSDQRLRVHRVVYELFIGPLPDDLTIDHICHNRDLSCPPGVCEHRRCCNPAHLEAVPRGVNVSRGAARIQTCVNGHPKIPENRYALKRGGTVCRICTLDQQNAKYHRTKVLKGPRTHCRRGHEYNEKNTYTYKAGNRQCRLCKNERRRTARSLSI